ncbi:MAG: bifunctional isocitrate dehydrogenase kinase/phosphatase, partial [Sphingopyxis sp.]|nr:bifunctional isocitrate dehydrogenase kinase/phosphatase [Sphingopyxis sp.]
EYIENGESAARPAYRAYSPRRGSMGEDILAMVRDFGLRVPFEDLERDAACVLDAMRPFVEGVPLRANFQIQVLASLFFRNKGAYVIGKLINGFQDMPFALPILHGRGGLVIDAALFGEDDLLTLFSFARAYFMVDMEVPSACVQFLRGLMPRKPRAELYNALGLAKQGKTLFYRDFLHHLRHSTDRFRIAPGIRGMVMLVFDLPSLPQQGGHNVRVFENVINDNSTPNFAPAGNIVASVPTGTGVLVMANRNVEVFGNVFDQNGTANVMIVGYRYDHKDPNYQPLPKAIVVRGNQHGKAGYAPAFEGGDMIAAAMGGAIPPVLWDGAGDAIVLDKVGVLSLNLPDVKTPRSEAKPAPADLSKGTPPAALPTIKLPGSMEAKVK